MAALRAAISLFSSWSSITPRDDRKQIRVRISGGTFEHYLVPNEVPDPISSRIRISKYRRTSAEIDFRVAAERAFDLLQHFVNGISVSHTPALVQMPSVKDDFGLQRGKSPCIPQFIDLSELEFSEESDADKPWSQTRLGL